MPPTKPFTPILPPTPTKPKSQWVVSTTTKVSSALSLAHTAFLKDQLSLSTLLSLGAILQSILYATLPKYYAFLPATLLILYRITDAFLQACGYKTNPYMRDIVPTKFCAQFPSSNGTFSTKPADKEIVVFMIGARCNHPMGMFAPGFKELGNYFQDMSAYLEKNSSKYGLLTQSAYCASGERASNNELMSVMYFETLEGLHSFAHSKEHTEGWNWWNKTVKQHPHLSIYHETFVVPKGNWETVYVNCRLRGLAASAVPVSVKGETQWMSAAVDAKRMDLKSMKGRFGMKNGEEDKNVVEEPYGEDS